MQEVSRYWKGLINQLHLVCIVRTTWLNLQIEMPLKTNNLRHIIQSHSHHRARVQNQGQSQDEIPGSLHRNRLHWNLYRLYRFQSPLQIWLLDHRLGMRAETSFQRLYNSVTAQQQFHFVKLRIKLVDFCEIQLKFFLLVDVDPELSLIHIWRCRRRG